MAEVISILEARKKKGSMRTDDLNDLIKRASIICKEAENPQPDGIGIVGENQLKSVFERRITEEIFRRKLISSDVFMCGIYVSNLLEELALTAPESWWAVDYFGVDDSMVLKKGGDTCFVICGIFPERANRRLVDVSYYEKMGASFYYQFYSQAGKEIGYYMSRQFQNMVEVVQSCIGRI